MNNYEKIYWLTRLDAIGEFCLTLVIIGSLLIGGRAVYKWYSFMDNDDVKVKPNSNNRIIITDGKTPILIKQ